MPVPFHRSGFSTDELASFTALLFASGGTNLLFSILFIVLRLRTPAGMMTGSQRWGLSIFSAIFLLNGLTILFIPSIYSLYPEPANGYLLRVTTDLALPVAFLIIALGAIFPRPFLGWRQLSRFFLLLAGTAMLLTVLLVAEWNGLYVSIPYLFAWSVFPVLWLWQCHRERSDEIRMVLVLLAWGFIFTPVGQTLMHLLLLSHPTDYRMGIDLSGAVSLGVSTVPSVAIIALIVYSLWVRRGRWAMAERLSLSLLAVVALPAFIAGTSSIKELARASEFITVQLGWMVIRPLLLSIGLLRYQMFGREVRADSLLRAVGWGAALLFTAALTQFFLPGAGTVERVSVGFAAALLVAYPAWLGMRRLVARLLPVSGGEARASMAERRSAYLVGLQTAVVGGEVADERDALALAELRKRLGVTEREHALLMTFFPRPEKVHHAPEVQELFLMLKDGRLVAHAGKLGEEKDVVASMLAAIRGFVEEGLKGGKKELDTVKYGDYTLIMESEENMVLAALVLGPETTDVRVLLRDALAETLRAHGSVLKAWDGALDRLGGVDGVLARALAPSR